MPLKNKDNFKTWVEISASAIKHNIKVFRGLTGQEKKLMAVVKSNAYGHGLVETALIADKRGAEWFGVDSVDEALLLRESKFKKPILVLGYARPSRVEDMVKQNISFVAYNPDLLKELKRLSKTGALKKTHAKLHLKIETGTFRQGLNGDELLSYAKAATAIPGVEVQGMYTHFANIEDTTDRSFADLQLSRFTEAKKLLNDNGIYPKLCHSACSAAALLFPETHFDMIRMGVSMYGLWPSKETRAVMMRQHKDVVLKPALTWKTRIAQIKNIPKGTSVSYGLTETVSRKSRIAILPVGYWDGYDRGLSNVGHVLIHGTRCKIMGRICMNMCLVDVTDVSSAKVGQEVTLLGKDGDSTVSADEIAGQIATINYEVVTRINPLLPRVIID